MLWHSALLHVANALLQLENDDDWFFYFRVCIYGYRGLSRSWRVADVISRALLTMSIRSGGVSSSTARRILAEMEGDRHHEVIANLRVPFMVDLGLGMVDPERATGESLAAHFEQEALFQDFTNEFGDSKPN